MDNKQITLAIETAIQGGSLSLLKGSRELDFWLGSDKVSKAEDILEKISFLLTRNKIEKHQIDLITVSNDFGSATGIRIGKALARGLKKSLNCSLIEVSVLEAMQLKAGLTKPEQTIVTAVPVGNIQIYRQIFANDNSKNNCAESPVCLTLESFVYEIETFKNAVLIVQQSLYEKLNEIIDLKEHDLSVSILTENNLAKWVGIYGKERSGEEIYA